MGGTNKIGSELLKKRKEEKKKEKKSKGQMCHSLAQEDEMEADVVEATLTLMSNRGKMKVLFTELL